MPSSDSDRPLSADLTGREMQILDLLSENLSSKEVGLRLGLSCRTIDNHCVKIVRKLGARDRYDAVRVWQRNGKPC